MYILHRPDAEIFVTIHHEDEEKFYEVSQNFSRKLPDGTYIPCNNNFKLIKSKDEIKQILEDNFSSKSRGGDYTTGLPSATLISSALFPTDVEKDFNILNWKNSTTLEDMKAQNIKNKLSTDSGEFIHEILENAFKDRGCRLFDKKRSLEKYISKVCSTDKIHKIINNFDDRKEYFQDMAQKTLKDFFANEVENIDPIFNEIFVKNDGIQGAIDMVCMKNKKLYLTDFKTSKKSCSRAQIPHKGYLRQLYIYSRMLLRLGIISQKEYDNLNFQIYFFNWNSYRSAIYEYSKKEIDTSKAYVNFILNWYYKMKDMDLRAEDIL